MTTIKRTIVILILLAIAFFIYRGISPSGAERLLGRIKAIPTMFWGSGAVSSGTELSLPTGQFLELTGEYLVTGSVQKTGLIDILSGTESGTLFTGSSSTTVTGASSHSSTTSVKESSSSSSSSQELSSKDIHDTETLLKNLFQ